MWQTLILIIVKAGLFQSLKAALLTSFSVDAKIFYIFQQLKMSIMPLI